MAAFFRAADLESAQLSPETLTRRGNKSRYGELDDHTEAFQHQQMTVVDAQLARMKREFNRSLLSETSQLSYDLFERLAERQRTLLRWYWQIYEVESGGSALDDIPPLLITRHSVQSIADARAYILRIRAVERVANQISVEIDQRRMKGFLPPALVFARVIPDAENQLKGAPFDAGADNAVWADFKQKVSALKVETSEKDRLYSDATQAMKGPWRKGYIRYLAALEAMAKKAVENSGVWALPKGSEYYADMLKYHTTTDLSADQIHQTGLGEVVRLRHEMDAIKARIGFTGPLEAFFAHIKQDASFRYPNNDAGKQECLADARTFVAGYMAVATKQFLTTPREPLQVSAVEPFRERTAPAVPAYQRGTPDGRQPGILYINLSDMTQVLKPQLAALTYHEGVPGHHFQISRQYTQPGLPDFRRFLIITAYTEGWALYAEGLTKEAGFYRDPMEDFGRLSLQLLRAARLVLDTGIHAKRWSREQAVAYMRHNTLNSERDIQSEIDRYFTDPGQATGYMIGQLKVLALRQKAETTLGAKYDVRAFHDVVLKSGALPLDMLEKQVDAYVSRGHL